MSAEKGNIAVCVYTTKFADSIGFSSVICNNMVKYYLMGGG
ncbi:hypothetical protein HNR52_001181 [Thermoanaerobacterium thermosulfurigenes]